MAEEEIHHGDGRVEHPTVRNEPTDASFRWILGLILGAMVFAAVVHYVILVFFNHYNAYESAVRKSPYPLAPTLRPGVKTDLPPEPRLEQLDRLSGIQKPNVYLREQSKEEILAGYGKTDEKGFVRVPVERAMHYLAEQKKLPAREQKGEDPRASGLVDGGGPNSGRLFREKARWYER